MKGLISSMVVLVLCSFLLVNCAPGNEKQIAPDFLAATIEGETFALRDHLRGQGGNKVLILAFFNTGCKPCEEDLRYLQRVYGQYKEDGLDVVCIFTEYSNKSDVIKKFTQKLDLKLPVLLDKHGTICKRYNVTGLPCQYVIDREGLLRFRYLGCSEGVKARLEENLRELLSASFSPPFLISEIAGQAMNK